jgi:hypothetical protein
VHGACLEVDVAFATPIPDTLVSRVTSGHPRLGSELVIEGVSWAGSCVELRQPPLEEAPFGVVVDQGQGSVIGLAGL